MRNRPMTLPAGTGLPVLLGHLALAGLGACAAPLASESARAPAPRPNIVLLLADDLGYRDLGCYGSELHLTPHLDRLAEQGTRFTQAYANAPNCAPSRACLMSGQYAPRHGIYTVGSAARGRAENRRLVPVRNRTELADAVVTLPETLRAAGYATAHLGKWHLGPDPKTQGYDHNFGGNRAGHPKSYFSPYRNPDLSDGPAGEYLTTRLTDEAVQLLDGFAATPQPFLLSLSYYTVHTPIQPEPARLQAARARGLDRRSARYAAMVEALDASVGRILGRIDDLGLRNDTLVVFFSDNGGVGGWTSMAPLRGAKGMLYEGGIREPLLVRWPGHVAAGATSDAVVCGTDFYPTFAACAGVAMPKGQPADGLSLLPLWTRGSELPERALHWHFPAYLENGRSREQPWRTTPVGAVRRGRFKLLEFFEDGRLELYDLRADVGEQRNLARVHPETAAALHAEMKAWRRQVGAAMPTAKAR